MALPVTLLSGESLRAGEPSPAPVPAVSSPVVPVPVVFTIGSFLFTRPQAWTWVIPSSAMRKVELSVPAAVGTQGAREGKEAADVSFFYFGKGQGGNIQANVERWAKQFTSPDGSAVKAVTESRTIASIPVTFVSAHGSFSSGMTEAASDHSDYALRGAILESPEGDVFVKMTGPAPLVKDAIPVFDAMMSAACQESEAR